LRHGTMNSFRMTAALVAMGALALAAMATLNGCGGPTGTGVTPVVGLRVQGQVRDEQGRAVSGIRIIVQDDRSTTIGSALSGADGKFLIELGSRVTPATFKMDVATRANEYYDIIGYGGRNVQGCPINLPSPVGNLINVGVITVYSQGTPPPPPHEICP
jgi:hypothetical protein